MILQDVERKARYGHKNWVVFRDSYGDERAAVATRDSIKAALLAVGSQGSFTLVHANCGTKSRMNWAMGIVAMRNVQYWGKA